MCSLLQLYKALYWKNKISFLCTVGLIKKKSKRKFNKNILMMRKM